MAKRELPDILTESEQSALLSVFNRRYRSGVRNHAMVLLALRTGMRVSELVNLRWEDIEQDTGRVHLKVTKGGRHRIVWIGPEVLAAIAEVALRFNRDRAGLVFTTDKGGALDTGYLRRMITTYAQRAGIKKRVHFHLLRHTYLSNLYVKTKGDIRTVQEIAGHADLSTTMIYTHVSNETIRDAMLS